MIRGTTPTHTFVLPIQRDLVKKLRIIYAQRDNVLFVKEMDECIWEENTVIVKLTKEDTFLFELDCPVQIQIRILTQTDDSIASDIKLVSVDKCLEDEVL